MAADCGPEQGIQRHPAGDLALFRSFRLALAEQRHQGVPFDQAWDACLPRTWTRGDSEVPGTRGLLESQRSAWQAAYERKPPRPAERAVAQLALVLSEEPGRPNAERTSLLG